MPIPLGEPRDLVGAGEPIGKVPQHVQRQRRADSRQPVHVGGIAELLLDGRRGGGLKELAETGARVREAPGRHFDSETVQRVEHASRPL